MRFLWFRRMCQPAALRSRRWQVDRQWPVLNRFAAQTRTGGSSEDALCLSNDCVRCEVWLRVRRNDRRRAGGDWSSVSFLSAVSALQQSQERSLYRD